jgi:peptidoglycan biosynthesis protein MviN/MurJ (putative lipid II flippase)
LTQAIGLTRVMFVSMVFLALSAFATGYLNVHRQFGVPALAPTVFNVVIIAGVLVLAPRIGVLGIAVSFLAIRDRFHVVRQAQIVLLALPRPSAPADRSLPSRDPRDGSAGPPGHAGARRDRNQRQR